MTLFDRLREIPTTTRHVSALSILLVCSLAINVSLSLDLRGYRRAARARIDASQILKPGMSVPELTARALDGRPVVIRAADSVLPTMLYVFSPQCAWCQRNLTNVRDLAAAAQGKYRLIGISLSSKNMESYLEAHDLRFQVITDPTDESRAAYQLIATPRTIVLDQTSHVVKVWNGAYGPDTAREIEEFFSIRLSGLDAIPAEAATR